MALPITPLINGKSYEWSDITLNIGNNPIVGITNIEYDDVQAMENIYGAGANPVSRGYGSVTPTAKITLKMEEVENIMAAAPNGRLQLIPEFDITVAFVDASLVTRKHLLRNVRFMNNKRVANQGDTSLDVEMDLIISHIDWN